MKRTILAASIVLLSFAAGAAEGLLLQECLRQALAKNETITVQREKLAQARSLLREKSAAHWPTLGLAAGYTRLPYLSAAKAAVLGNSLDDYTLNLTLRQPLYAGGRLRAEQEIATLGLQRTESELRRAEQELTLNTAAAYYRAVHAAEVLAASRASRDHLREHFDRSTGLSRLTRLPRPEELLQIEVQLGNAEIAVELASLNRRSALRALKELIRAEGEDELVLTDPLAGAAAAANYGALPLAENHELRAARSDLAAADQARTVARSALWPALNLNAYSGWEWGAAPPSRDYTQWGISLELLLFDFMKTPARADQVESLYRQAALGVELLERRLRLAWQNALDALAASGERLKLAEQNRVKALASLALYRARAQSYTANSRQLLDAEQAALQAELSRLNVLLDHRLNRLELARLAGRSEL